MTEKSNLNKIKNFFVLSLATGFGSGYLPKAPGTFGTLVGIPIFYALYQNGPLNYMLVTLVLTIIACIVAEVAGHLLKATDSPHIVIDEIVGFLVTMTWLPMTWQAITAGFILFRIFDITKPGPIRFVERKIPGGIGVVMDDIAAGIVANIILQLIYSKTDWLGAQLAG